VSDSILTKPKRKTDTEYEAEADQLLAEMNRLEEKMDRDRLEIDRLRSETRQLKIESDVIAANTAATLASINRLVDRLAGAA
jgi:hypothetical protein